MTKAASETAKWRSSHSWLIKSKSSSRKGRPVWFSSTSSRTKSRFAFPPGWPPLEAAQVTLSDNQLIQLQLIKQIREAARKEPQPLQKDRAEILRALLAATGGKMLAKDARQKMHIKKRRIFEEEEENRAIYCKRLSRVRRENWLKFEFN